MTPIMDSLCIFSSAIGENGISLGAKINILRSFIITLAARVIRLSAIPHDIFARVFILHGVIIIASAPYDPEATEAHISVF